MIKGVQVKKLKAIFDSRGFLMEMLREDDPIFERFGQVYMTCCKPGAVKGWHYHKKQTDHFVCVLGKALVVLYDLRKSSPTYGQVNEFILKAPVSKKDKPYLLKIPKMVVHGFCSLGRKEARIVNIPTKLYNYKNPDEFRFPWNSSKIPYRWPKFIKRGG